MFPPNQQGQEVAASNPSVPATNRNFQQVVPFCQPCGQPPQRSFIQMEEQQVNSSKNSETYGEGQIMLGGEKVNINPDSTLSSNSQPVVNDVKNDVEEQASKDLVALVSSPQMNSAKSPSNNVKVETKIAVAKPSATSSLRGKTFGPNNENSKVTGADIELKVEPAETSERNSVTSPRGKSLLLNEETVPQGVNCTSTLQSKQNEDSNSVTDATEAKDEPAVTERSSAVSPRGKTLVQHKETIPQVANGAPALQSNHKDSNNMADATEVKDEPATTERPSSMPLRGKVLPRKGKMMDQLEHAPADDIEGFINETPPVSESATAAPSAPLLDDSGNPIEYNQNDVFLSMKNPTYRAIMHEQYQKLGSVPTREGDKKSANEVFQRFKKRGGRFFKPQGQSTQYTEVNEEKALEKIQMDYARRMQAPKTWQEQKNNNSAANSPSPDGVQGYSIPRKKRKEGSIPAQNNENSSKAKKSKMKPSSQVIPAVGRSSHRTRKRPQNFMDAQGQDLLTQETLRKLSAAAKKKRKRGADDFDKPWTANENREFEQGCIRHGWGNWDLVQALVPGRTSEECENYSGMIEVQFPDTIDRLVEEHKEIWVYPDRKQPSVSNTLTKQSQQLKMPAKPPPTGDRGEGPMNVRKSSRAKEATWKTKDDAHDASKFPLPKLVKKVKGGSGGRSNASEPDKRGSVQSIETKKAKEISRVKAKRNRESKNDPSTSDLTQPTDDTNVRRPMRQSAINARKMFATLGSEDENDDSTVDSLNTTGSARTSQKIQLEPEKDKLLKELSSAPSNNGEYYEEESAWRFHNPDFPEDSVEQLTALRNYVIPCMPAPTPPKELQPLPPAPPLPQLPSTDYCKWSFDEKSRVLLANFRDSSYANKKGKIKVASEDEYFLFLMMERDDITVVSEGVADAINPSLWTREYIEGCIGSEYHHKFRGFETIPQEGDPGEQVVKQAKEKEGWYSMKVSDYFRYLEQRQSVKNSRLNNTEEKEDSKLSNTFSFTDSYGKEKSVNVDNEALYMIDVDMVKLLPQAFEDLQRNFKLPGILPGGSHCMMNAVNANGRPFMGPNLYITPPSSFTHFHQDGHGTVDSGHLCLSGYNEVVMLRRLTERHKCHAIQILTGTSDSHGALYGLPHRDGLETQLGWPSKEAIRQCEKMGYYPSLFILKAGQVVHINKGRLHAFRKLAPSSLLETDCHHDLRNEILQSKKQPIEDVCFSIAWDWMFKGVTSEGINREVSGILECARLNQEHGLQSLAIPETTLLFLAKENIAKHLLKSETSATNSLFAMDIPLRPTRRDIPEPDAETVLRGILPSLQYVVSRHNASVKFCKVWEEKTKHVMDSWRVSIDSKPNAWEGPGTFALDAYGAGDFFCKFCSEELSNVYMHCDGCEKLLNKAFNICSSCHMEGKYKVFYKMHPFNSKTQSILNHTGNKTQLRRARCPCKNGKECTYCSYCTGCSCRCHQHFTLHYRFMGLGNELEILQNAERIVGSDSISQTVETKARLISLLSGDLPQEEEVMPKSDDVICQVIEENKQTTRRIGPAAAITAATAAASLEQEELEEEEAMTEEPSTRPAAAAKPEIERLLEKAKEADGDETAAMLLLRQNKKEKKKTRTTVAVGKKSNTSGVNSDHNVETSLETTKVTSRANKEALQEPASEKEEDVSKPLPVMEVAGCIKCHKEMETGKKTKKPHSDHCPRKRVAFKVFPTMAHAPSSMIPDPSKEEDGVCFQVATEVPQVARKEKKLRVRNKKKTEVSQANGEATETKSASGKGGGRKENGDIGLSLPSQNIDVENKSAQSENFKTANQTKVEYTCPKCDRKFTFSSSRAAPGAFGNHLKHCDPEKKRKKLQKSQNYQNSAEEEDFLGDETQVSLNEILQNAERIVGSDLISQTVETKARLISLISGGLPQEEEVMPTSDDVICQIIDGDMATYTKSAPGKGGGRKESGDIGLFLPSQKIDVENKSAQNENFKTANQTKVEYTCPKCDRKFTFSSSRAAPGAFGNHLKHCDPEKKQKKLQKSQNYQNSAEEEDFLGDETQVSLNEPLAEARAPIDLNELKAGSLEVSQANGEATETKSASGKGGGRKENGDIGLSLPSQNIDVENKSAQSENFKTANQTKVEYTCPKCD
eukprot:CAMPEP_0172328380 /NCGR_PEP_ID=MMETSP1058-20130122/60322_1 /TAXON_ID=83371 /ORGANISM="Detonula confervacea, Strain CCMP 353" /LENGTH=2122 /DNA_ID=CAMNT_0013045493 /DNA_START=119 /DNA_END=6484 /DNA_ORIENTATION=+